MIALRDRGSRRRRRPWWRTVGHFLVFHVVRFVLVMAGSFVFGLGLVWAFVLIWNAS